MEFQGLSGRSARREAGRAPWDRFAELPSPVAVIANPEDPDVMARPSLAGNSRDSIPGMARISKDFPEFLDFYLAFQQDSGVLGGPGRS